jgi:hypothetical protein
MVEETFEGVLLVEPVELEDEWVLVGVVEDPVGNEITVGIPPTMLVKAPITPPRPPTEVDVA